MRVVVFIGCGLLLLLAPIASAQQALPGNGFPESLTPAFMTGQTRTVQGAEAGFALAPTVPPAGSFNFVAPGVNVLNAVNLPSQRHWYALSPSAKDMEITTAAVATLYFTANAQAVSVFEVRVYNVAPDGRLEILAQNSQQFITALSPTPVEFPLLVQGKVLREGHLLRVSVYAQTGNGVVVMNYGGPSQTGGATPSGLSKLFVRWLDTDADGVSDSDERREGTNPLDATDLREGWRDSDGDGLSDAMERTLGTDLTRADTDGDGFIDGVEVFAGSDPRSASSKPTDQNGNGLPDHFETNYSNNTTVINNNPSSGLDPQGDPDQDGCNNLCEAAHGTNPFDRDTDGDGEKDGDEIAAGTDPLEGPATRGDSDNDGLSDTLEDVLGTDPNDADTDGDGFGDGVEFFAGSDPRNPNSRPEDRNANGLPDVFETKYFNTTIREGRPGIDPHGDPDRDGCDNLCEAAHGTDPTRADSDRDGVDDGEEIRKQSNPLEPEGPGAATPTANRAELHVGAALFASVSILSLFGMVGRNFW